jgi:hypothetical protein
LPFFVFCLLFLFDFLFCSNSTFSVFSFFCLFDSLFVFFTNHRNDLH